MVWTSRAGAGLAHFSAMLTSWIGCAALCLVSGVATAPTDDGQDSNPDTVMASIGRPVSSTSDLPSISFNAAHVLRDGRPVAYTAQFSASVDGSEFTPVAEVRPGKGTGGRH
jgi:hypothetical protein